MRTILRYSSYVVITAIIALVISYALSKDNLSEFISNFFLNLVAEFLGIAIGGVLAAFIAYKLATDKLDKLAPDLVALIAQLRKGRTINEKAARQCVICTVSFISEESLLQARDTAASISITTLKCPVCELDADVVRSADGHRHCTHYHLQGNVWNRKELKI